MPALSLRDIYGALFYYLDRTEEVEAYLAKRERQADEIEQDFRNLQAASLLQRRLEVRRACSVKCGCPTEKAPCAGSQAAWKVITTIDALCATTLKPGHA